MTAIILAAVLMAQATPQGEKKIEIDGARYRVFVRKTEVIVARKAFLSRRSPEEREAMKRAVQIATGCEIIDPYWEGPRLVGKIACPVNPSSPTN